MLFTKHQDQLPLTAESIARATKKDEHLGKMLQLLEGGGCVARAGYKSPEINYKLSSGCLTFEHAIVMASKGAGRTTQSSLGSY